MLSFLCIFPVHLKYIFSNFNFEQIYFCRFAPDSWGSGQHPPVDEGVAENSFGISEIFLKFFFLILDIFQILHCSPVLHVD